MKHLKTYKQFENADGSATAGSGDVVNSQPGALPGTFGTDGSGDMSFYLNDGKKRKKRIKKGNPSQVSDLRFLAPVKTNKITESIDEDLVKDCVIELIDEGFELIDIENSEISLKISLLRGTDERVQVLSQYGNVRWSIRGYSGKNNFIIDDFGKAAYKKISKKEKRYLELAEESIHKLINFFDFAYGDVYYVCMFDENFKDNYKISITLWKSILNPEKNISESYTEQEYFNEVSDELKKYNITPLELNRILDFYENDILSDLDSGQHPKTFVDRIVKEMDLDGSGGFMSQRAGMPANQTIKYL